VTPWRVDGLGVVHLRALPPRDSVGPGADRVARLLADIAAGTAVFTLEARGADTVPLARVVLVERLPSDGKALHTSMWNNGRGFHPTGARNGIRAVVYGVSQPARGLRGGQRPQVRLEIRRIRVAPRRRPPAAGRRICPSTTPA